MLESLCFAFRERISWSVMSKVCSFLEQAQSPVARIKIIYMKR